MTLGQISWMVDALWGHPNQTSEDEIRILYKIIEANLSGNGVRMLEIGSWMGCSTVPLARIAKLHQGKVYCCDSWMGTPVDDLSRIAKSRNVFNIFWRRLGDAFLQDTVIPMRGLSKDVLPILGDKLFDVIYIDGDHRYEGVRFDINQALRLVRRGGLITGHDFGEGYPGVTKAVTETFNNPQHEGRVWWVKQ